MDVGSGLLGRWVIRVRASYDLAIVGGGVIGSCVALAWRRRHPRDRILVLEKEAGPGAHASGRNSGVLHAGFYYSADSLKARFCREGNARWQDFCRTLDLPCRACGKLVVAQRAEELPGLRELYERGRVNGVDLHLVDAAEARRLEPRVKTHEQALWSPATASIDPTAVMQALWREMQAAGIEIVTGEAFRRFAPRTGRLRTSRCDRTCGYLINAAGAYADRIAQSQGYGGRYRVLPFKGVYLYSGESPGALRRHIYPVPDPAYPFLGVHYTVAVDGHVKIGPTAMPAFWREHYRGFDNFSVAELLAICGCELGLLVDAGFPFRRLAMEEMKKYSRRYLVAQAAALITGVDQRDYRRWGRPGIRAQLLDLERRTLVMDFVCEGGAGSFHVLNAVSPAFTCALPFAEFVLDRVAAARAAA